MPDSTAPDPAAAGRSDHLSPRPARPLPDAVAIRAVPVPRTAPPFDDEVAAGTDPAPVSRGLPAPARPAAPARASEPAPARLPAPPGGTWPARVAQVLAETLAGSRPASQITPWTTDQARERIRKLGPALATGQRPQVRRVIVTAPASDVLEMTVIVSFGTRVRAMAVRMERARATVRHRPAPPGIRAGEPVSWRCTAIEAA